MKLHHLAVAGGVAWLTTHWLRGGFGAALAPREDGETASTPAYEEAGQQSIDDVSHDDVSSSPLDTARALHELKAQERPELGFPNDGAKHNDDAKPGLSDFARGA